MTYVFNLFHDITESEGTLAKLTAATGIATSLYDVWPTVQSLLGLGVADKDSTNSATAALSNYGPRTQRAELLREIKLPVLDEASTPSNKGF